MSKQEKTVTILPHFRKQLKPLVKKYPSLKKDFMKALDFSDANIPTSLGHNLYKIRLSPKELQKGKNKSLRCIMLYIKKDNHIIPVTIYSKSDKANMPVKELETHTEMILFELSQ